MHNSHYPCKICTTITKNECSGTGTNWRNARQKMFNCTTCDVDQICQSCKRVCHEEHDIEYTGLSTFVCNCNQKKNCNLFYCKVHPTLQLPCIACNFKSNKRCIRMSPPKNEDQKWACYTCHTCRITSKLCKSCALTCHQRHNIEKSGYLKH